MAKLHSHREDIAGERSGIRQHVVTALLCEIDHGREYGDVRRRLVALLRDRLKVRTLDSDLEELIGEFGATAAGVVAEAAYEQMFAGMPLLYISKTDMLRSNREANSRAA